MGGLACPALRGWLPPLGTRASGSVHVEADRRRPSAGLTTSRRPGPACACLRGWACRPHLRPLCTPPRAWCPRARPRARSRLLGTWPDAARGRGSVPEPRGTATVIPRRLLRLASSPCRVPGLRPRAPASPAALALQTPPVVTPESSAADDRPLPTWLRCRSPDLCFGSVVPHPLDQESPDPGPHTGTGTWPVGPGPRSRRGRASQRSCVCVCSRSPCQRQGLGSASGPQAFEFRGSAGPWCPKGWGLLL